MTKDPPEETIGSQQSIVKPADERPKSVKAESPVASRASTPTRGGWLSMPTVKDPADNTASTEAVVKSVDESVQAGLQSSFRVSSPAKGRGSNLVKIPVEKPLKSDKVESATWLPFSKTSTTKAKVPKDKCLEELQRVAVRLAELKSARAQLKLQLKKNSDEEQQEKVRLAQLADLVMQPRSDSDASDTSDNDPSLNSSKKSMSTPSNVLAFISSYLNAPIESENSATVKPKYDIESNQVDEIVTPSTQKASSSTLSGVSDYFSGYLKSSNDKLPTAQSKADIESNQVDEVVTPSTQTTSPSTLTSMIGTFTSFFTGPASELEQPLLSSDGTSKHDEAKEKRTYQPPVPVSANIKSGKDIESEIEESEPFLKPAFNSSSSKQSWFRKGVSSILKPNNKSEKIDVSINKLLKIFKQIAGVYNYYQVIDLFFRPFVLLISALTIYDADKENIVNELIAVLIFIYALFYFQFPFYSH